MENSIDISYQKTNDLFYNIHRAFNIRIGIHGKYLQNEESVEMLHLIYDSVYIEPSVLFTNVISFTNGPPISYLREMIGYNKQGMASSLSSWTPTITNGLADIKAAFQALDE